MKAARLYLPMVGIPFIGVLAVLQFGERLQAAPAMHGVWRVRSAAVSSGSPSCVEQLTTDSLHTIIAAQSGPRVSLQVRSADAAGWGSASLRVADHAAAGPFAELGGGECAGRAAMTLRLPDRAVADSLYGTLADTTCAGCVRLEFVATRRRTPR